MDGAGLAEAGGSQLLSWRLLPAAPGSYGGSGGSRGGSRQLPVAPGGCRSLAHARACAFLLHTCKHFKGTLLAGACAYRKSIEITLEIHAFSFVFVLRLAKSMKFRWKY